jgi:hypothetical protein
MSYSATCRLSTENSCPESFLPNAIDAILIAGLGKTVIGG